VSSMNGLFRLRTVVSPMYEENCYIVARPSRLDCLVIDPGLDPRSILMAIESEELSPAMVLNTHGHADHIAGNGALKEAHPGVPLVIGRSDEPMLADSILNLSALSGFPVTSPPADRLVSEGDILEIAGFQLEVFDIPGHSPGHVVYVQRFPGGQTVVFGGDVLFRGSIGRTDFPGGDHDLLIRGIRGKLFTLPDDTLVYPGHGPVTTVGREKRSNPFCGLE
jgi:hydroxyacylglutathione hydrolase